MYANGDDAVDVPAYTDNNVSTKVIKLIQSYTGIINKMVWRK
jgi:UDP-N-acetylglucosamine 2-epimerase (non-hydrolysing)